MVTSPVVGFTIGFTLMGLLLAVISTLSARGGCCSGSRVHAG
jgi:hypothetical protein